MYCLINTEDNNPHKDSTKPINPLSQWRYDQEHPQGDIDKANNDSEIPTDFIEQFSSSLVFYCHFLCG